MRRALIILASGLAAAAVAGAVVYGLRSQRAANPAPAEIAQAVAEPHRVPRADTEVDPADSRPNETTIAQDEQSPSSRIDERVRSRQLPDEATVRADMRKEATRDVQRSYSLLLDDLDLPPQDEEDLVELLVEMQIESMWTSTSTGEIRGRKIPGEERHDRIAAVIGDKKLQQFLTLEQSLRAYGETQFIASMLRRNGAPLTEMQREGLFGILVDVQNQYLTERPATLDPNSFESLEARLDQLDEYARHVVELAPSVLSPNQVARVFERYQRASYERADALEMQKKRKAANPDDDLPLFYPATAE